MANGLLTQGRGRGVRRQRAWQLAALLLTVLVGSIGCNPIATLGFLGASWGNDNVDARCPLTIDDKESKVAIICFHEKNIAANPTFHDADRLVAQLLTAQLTQRYKDNKDKVKIVSATKVDKYMREHHDFLDQPKQEIGKCLDADLLVFLELGPMTMYAPGSFNTVYQGSVEVRIVVYDAHEPDGESAKYPPELCLVTYPNTEWGDANSMRPTEFREKFLQQIGKDFVPYFAACPPPDKKRMGE